MTRLVTVVERRLEFGLLERSLGQRGTHIHVFRVGLYALCCTVGIV